MDDDSLVHVTLRSLINWEHYGYTVVGDCSNGNQALSFLKDHTIDLLITDIKMPGMSGLELMAKLRQQSHMPVTVALSGYDEFELVREAFRLGAYPKADIEVEKIKDDFEYWNAMKMRASANQLPDVMFKNHVSILFWSCGNESYAGADILAMADYFRA